jgi:hypothetical protein
MRGMIWATIFGFFFYLGLFGAVKAFGEPMTYAQIKQEQNDRMWDMIDFALVVRKDLDRLIAESEARQGQFHKERDERNRRRNEVVEKRVKEWRDYEMSRNRRGN